MPVVLLDSQLTTLEPSTEALIFSSEKSPQEIAAALIYALKIGD